MPSFSKAAYHQCSACWVERSIVVRVRGEMVTVLQGLHMTAEGVKAAAQAEVIEGMMIVHPEAGP